MEPYKEMYFELAGALAQAIEILQQAQKKAEEIYMDGGKPVLKLAGIKPINGGIKRGK